MTDRCYDEFDLAIHAAFAEADKPVVELFASDDDYWTSIHTDNAYYEVHLHESDEVGILNLLTVDQVETTAKLTIAQCMIFAQTDLDGRWICTTGKILPPYSLVVSDIQSAIVVALECFDRDHT